MLNTVASTVRAASHRQASQGAIPHRRDPVALPRLRQGERKTYFFCAGCPPAAMPSSTLSTFVVAGS